MSEKTFFGHPRGLSTLFFTEMWERFSYYGMRALLTLFMTTATFETNPGLGFDVATAGAIYGLKMEKMFIEGGQELAEGELPDKPSNKEIERLLKIADRYGIEFELPTH